jgi:hypothetical protein
LKNVIVAALLVAVGLICAACGGSTEPEGIAAGEAALCPKPNGKVYTLKLDEVYERPGQETTSCGVWSSAMNPMYVYLSSQETSYTHALIPFPGARCQWILGPNDSTCLPASLAKPFFMFSNTAYCSGFPSGNFYLDVSSRNPDGTPLYPGHWTIHRIGEGNGCNTVYDAYVTITLN